MCCVCGSADAAPYVVTPDRLEGQPGLFTFVRCRRCGHVYLSPRPSAEALGKLYTAEYAAYTGPIEDEPRRFVRWNRAYGLAKRCRLVTSRRRPGRLLDVGCGTGVFLDAMRRRGWTVQGVEPTGAALAVARGRFGLDVFEGELADAAFPDASFDAVTLWYVIEHVPDPAALLAEVARVLRPGGIAVVSAPNLDAADRVIFGSRWPNWDPPRHLNIFSARSLGFLMKRHGLEPLSARSMQNTWLGLALGLQYVWEELRGIKPTAAYRQRRKWDAALAMQPLRVLLLPWIWLVDRLGLGTMLVVTARRAGAPPAAAASPTAGRRP